jgi:MarR family transcriptional regulator for hemolysin
MVAAKDADWTPRQMPTLLVVQLARLLTKLSDERLRSVGITASQLPVLVALKNGERRSQIELARIAGVEQPSMAQLLTRMERDGLIRREPAPEDRRSSLISLTDDAAARLEPGRTALRSIDRDACESLRDEERRLLIVLIERMMADVEGMS